MLYGGTRRTARVSEFGALPGGVSVGGSTFSDTFKPLCGIASELNRNVFLWNYLSREIGEVVPHYQGDRDGVEGEGDCVGHATALGCDMLAATNIHHLGKPERFVAKASVEMIYAGSRVEIGEGAVKGRAGSHGGWAARYVKEYGVLHRLLYRSTEDEKAINLGGYSPERSREYRDTGVPDWLEPIARRHPVREYTRVENGQEALDAVCAGQPVLMCSSYAFNDTRDEEGFAEPYLDEFFEGGNRRGWFRWVKTRKQWWHAMLLAGALIEGGRVGGALLNSHGAWNSGPRPHGLPEGGFFVDLAVLDLMVKDWEDCWALSSYVGHEAKKIRHKLYRG